MDKKKIIKKYSIGLDSVVEAISFVEQPAVDTCFVFLSDQKPLFLESDEKRLVYGCALRPDYPIYRRYNGEEFYITFSKECVEQLSQKFLKDGFQSNWTTAHKDFADNISVVESWIKVDAENDKSIALGLDKNLELGTWFIACKVENDEVWEQVKNGSFKGFSIEAMISLDEIELSKINKDDMQEEKLEMVEVNDNFWEKIKNIIVDALKSPSTPQTEAETTAEVVVADMIEESAPVVEEPIVETPMEEEVPQVEEEVMTEPEQIAEEVVEEVVEEAPNEEVAEESLQEVINKLNAKIDELNIQIEELKKVNVKLSKQPSTKPVSTRMSAQGNESNFDRMLAVMNGSAFMK